ncbi:MAG: glycosyltransferase, partial [Planctomycetaceae bacterium]|nr:glycosyltransferase [Planctomycetaceae bacterium]
MSRVSTIIPAYNAEKFISETVRSCLAQTHTDHEVIVVDDGSTDSTGELLREFGESIRVVQQENSGHVAARNAGAALATGNWIAFLDADDLWAPDKLSKQLEIASEDIGMVYTDRANFGETASVGATESPTHTLHSGSVFRELLVDNFVTVSSVIMRKSWIEKLGGFSPEPSGSEDWDLWLRFAAAGGKMAVVPEPLTHYRIHAGSMTHRFEMMHRGRVLTIERALQSDA